MSSLIARTDLNSGFIQKEPPKIQARKLPIPVWRLAIEYLTEREKDIPALVSRSLWILVVFDPSKNLERMSQRKAVRIDPRTLLPRFLPPQNKRFSFFNLGNLSRITQYLTEKEKGAFVCVSRRLRDIVLIVLHDHSLDLDQGKMYHRKMVHLDSLTALSRSPGPTERVLSFRPKPEDGLAYFANYKMREIQEEIGKDSTVSKTILDVCEIESRHPEYIPLYHATRIDSFVLSIFIRAFLSTPYLLTKDFPCSVPLIRFPDPKGPKTVEEFMDQYSYEYRWRYEEFDQVPEIRQELLSCNPHLFANLHSQSESSWWYFIGNHNVNYMDIGGFFSFCKHQKDVEQLVELHKNLCDLATDFAEQQTQHYKDLRTGVLLQILVPPLVLDKVAYAALPYGKKYTYSNKYKSDPLLSRVCLDLRNNPFKDDYDRLQVRILAQSLFVPNHYIKVVAHGYGGFFSDKDPIKPEWMSVDDWAMQEKRLARKYEITEKIKELFIKSMIPSPKKMKSS